ncbi:MAG: hypothetical protein GXP58_11695 [Deltaproteobacteria bacterium]|nr:hypothetical protein [Deltaproteobacteria bacterium]
MKGACFHCSDLIGVIDVKYADPGLQDCLRDPDRWFHDGRAKILKSMGNTRTVQFVCGGRKFLLKHYRFRGWMQALRSLLGGSRGAKAVRRSDLFLRAGIPTPRPVALLERRRFKIPRESYLCYEFLPEAENLTERYRRAGETLFLESKILSAIGRDAARIHGAGLYHGDLKWSNILVTEEVRGIARLIDLDGAGKASFRKEERFARDVSRFLVDLMENMNTSLPGMADFLRAYLECRRFGERRRNFFLHRIEEQVDEKLLVHVRTRGNRVRVAKGDITGILDGRDGVNGV